MSKITIPSHYQPMIGIYAPHKIGKTLLTLTAAPQGKLLIIDPQHGTDWMAELPENKRPHVWHIERYSEWEEVYNYLRNERHPYTWVVNDTTNKLHNLSLRSVIGAEGDKPLPSGISQPKRGLAGEKIKLMVDRFRKLPIGVIWTVNERVLEITAADNSDQALLDSEELEGTPSLDENTSEVKWVPDLPNDTRKYFVSELDIIGRLFTVPSLNGKRPERRLRLAPHPLYETGYRSYYSLPETMIKPNIARLVAQIHGKDKDA
jgi:hypothetical protein